MRTSSNRGPRIESLVLAMIVGASLTATLLVAVDSIDDEARRRSSQQFQALTGGLGMGSHSDLSRCPWLFDARLAGDQPPALGLTSYEPDGCLWHAMSIFPTPWSSLEESGQGEPDGGEPDTGAVHE